MKIITNQLIHFIDYTLLGSTVKIRYTYTVCQYAVLICYSYRISAWDLLMFNNHLSSMVESEDKGCYLILGKHAV